MMKQDTIAAIATPPGQGGVGIVRLSGKQALTIAKKLIQFIPKVRHAHYCDFYDQNETVLDQGIVLFFKAPHSFTGEDVIELQGHGGSVIMDLLLKTALSHGARLAQPGEFSQRAFMNDKMDLTQAEAIADLIESSSEQAARCAVRSLQGEFSKQIHTMVDSLVNLRIYVEASIDFPEEEIDFLADGKVESDLLAIESKLNDVFKQANKGTILREGMSVVIAGKPNAGKSSLLNALSGKDSAIVTDIAGTTRDVLREHIHIDGMPLHIIDTAGLRDAPNEVERIGIERAWNEIKQADQVLLVVDSQTTSEQDLKLVDAEFVNTYLSHGGQMDKITLVHNKTDQTKENIGIESHTVDGVKQNVIRLSAKHNQGIEFLQNHLKSIMGYDSTTEGGFIARRRHLESLSKAQESIKNGKIQLQGYGAGELLAEDLRAAQNALNEITGEFTSDDLLGKIFGSFCIGK
ncbi:MAG: tRNA uridine-5-carboxymethylaminomethyl(34) synthesis GTPase MnmE [Saccharospirillaceae bacterium]|nr:tRNA uridine-5-carboxymethylaminomethyl(34) synthesis GTPase MnmE [Pseudomonadales bacterium]NRB80945.1 tRNA uridine-5-carboxymethylaminomethyl(34) synthesis GTPase MnmE [Saccharospirillaceae bacterium]